MAERLQYFVPFFFLVTLSLLPIPSAVAATVTRRSALQLWCVAKNNAEDAALQSALDWACGAGRADCSALQPGGPCFEPRDVQSYASYAFNDYFLKNGFARQNCDFAGAAALTALNPSHGNCTFQPSGSSATNGSFVGLTPSGADDISGGCRHRQVAIFAWALLLLLLPLNMLLKTQ